MNPVILISLPTAAMVWEYFVRGILFSFIRIHADELGLDAFSGPDWIARVNGIAGLSVLVSNAYSGGLSDIYGRKPISIILTVFFILGLMMNILAIATNHLTLLTIAIGIQALGLGNLSVTFAAASDYANNEEESHRNQYMIQALFWGGQSLIQGLALATFYWFKSTIIIHQWVLLCLLPYFVVLFISILGTYGVIRMQSGNQILSPEQASIVLPFKAVRRLFVSNVAWATIIPFSLIIFTMHSINSISASLHSSWDLSASELSFFMIFSSLLGLISAGLIAPYTSQRMPLNTRIGLMMFFYCLALIPAIIEPEEWTAGIAILATGVAVPFIAGNILGATTKAEDQTTTGILLTCFNMADGLVALSSGFVISYLLKQNPLWGYEVALASIVLSLIVYGLLVRKRFR